MLLLDWGNAFCECLEEDVPLCMGARWREEISEKSRVCGDFIGRQAEDFEDVVVLGNASVLLTHRRDERL